MFTEFEILKMRVNADQGNKYTNKIVNVISFEREWFDECSTNSSSFLGQYSFWRELTNWFNFLIGTTQNSVAQNHVSVQVL